MKKIILIVCSSHFQSMHREGQRQKSQIPNININRRHMDPKSVTSWVTTCKSRPNIVIQKAPTTLKHQKSIVSPHIRGAGRVKISVLLLSALTSNSMSLLLFLDTGLHWWQLHYISATLPPNNSVSLWTSSCTFDKNLSITYVGWSGKTCLKGLIAAWHQTAGRQLVTVGMVWQDNNP